MKSGNHEFEIVYSKSEMEEMLQTFKAKGYQQKDIHVLANDKEIVESAGNAGVYADQANSFSNRFKSFLTGKDIVRRELDRFNLSKDRTDEYERKIEKGGVLLYTDGDAATSEDEHFSSLDDTYSPAYLESETPESSSSSQRTQEHHDPDEIYAREVSREDQHARAAQNNRYQDSRLKGDEIHPTGGLKKEEATIEKKEMDHEPGLQDGDNVGDVNRRQGESSPGVDPNLGPAPFDRNHKEIENEQEGYSSDHREIERKKDSDNTTPPTPRLF
ncbi:general stress protein [Planococcus donghaensis]|uniref:General stress protein 17M-like domain-containing protein n=1 Tax=Planococcus donghaensis TaxID=414778 RepID=A0A1C7EFL7_9BACL|nr:general stress protein [Planococcus donghaensis]ANU22650.1 hypothetical protein BCM40_04445 [Planococcus donghaensis]